MDVSDYVRDTINEYEGKTRKVWWLADKCFTLHSFTSFIFAVLFAFAGMWVSSGIVLFLWVLTFAIWQKWKNG